MRYVFWFFVLFGLWVIFSGQFTPFFLVTGFLSSLCGVYVSHRMGFLDRQLDLALRAPLYWLWLVKEVIISNIQVTMQVWAMPPKVEPNLYEIDHNLKKDKSLTIYANSITLTPGSVTVLAEDDKLIIHTLQKSTATDINTGYMEQKVAKVYE